MTRLNPGVIRNAGVALALEQLPSSGAGIMGNAVTDILYVSPNGNGRDGGSWTRAYQTIEDALDAASTDADDCTLILISPHATYYDINKTGDPTWTGNYILKGTHRNWAKVMNTHASATSIMKFTGKVALIDLNFNLGTGSGDGVIMTHGGARGYHLNFVGEDLTGAATALELVGGTNLKNAKFEHINILGHASHMTALKLDKCSHGIFRNIQIDDCLVGIHIDGAVSDENLFDYVSIGGCGIGMDIDAGNNQHIHNIDLFGCTVNIDDEVGDHHYSNIIDGFPVTLLPDDFTGVSLDTGLAANTWGSDTEILSAVSRTKPFRVTGISIEADANEKFRVRLSDDSGSTHFFDFQLDGEQNVNKRNAVNFPGNTEFIFNQGTRISGSAKSETGSNTAIVWLEIQEI